MSSSRPTVMSVLGARPQFVKLGPVSRALRARGLREIVVHTGQHYDFLMSESFFEELELPTPDVNLGVAAPGPVRQLGEMAPELEKLMRAEAPDLVLVFGDTTSTIAAALAASYTAIPVAHVEAGMRSFVPDMPEEIARVVTDRVSSLFFTASAAAGGHLEREGLGPVHFVGDTMYDVLLRAMPGLEQAAAAVLAQRGLTRGGYALATVHRARNTDDPARLAGVLDGLGSLPLPVVLPLHPRTRAAAGRHGLADRLERGDLVTTPPLRYLETMALARHARRVFTDSGGLQKEALYLGTPCTTLRDETEWVETVECGWNVLTGADPTRIRESLDHRPPTETPPTLYGAGRAGEEIADVIAAWLRDRSALSRAEGAG